jgi:hypothetical protein
MANLRFPQKVTSRANNATAANVIQWRSDWKGNATDINETVGTVENTPFEITSGTWKVLTDTIDGQTVKVLECVVAGVVTMKEQPGIQGVDPDEAAYGSWDFWILKGGAANVLDCIFVAEVIGAAAAGTQNGYLLRFAADESLSLFITTAGALTAQMSTRAAYRAINAWHRVRFTRSAVGAWTGYIDRVLPDGRRVLELLDVTGGAGTNPVTENTHAVSNYIALDFDAGDRIALSDLSGNYAISKYAGVVTP